MTTDKSDKERNAVTSGPQNALRPLDILTDIVGFFGLLFFWIFLWLPIPVFVVVTMKSGQSLKMSIVGALIGIALLFIFAVVARLISKAIILRSRVGLALGALLLFGLAFLLALPLWVTDVSTSQKLQSGSMVAVALVFGISCLLRALCKERVQ